MRVQTYEFFKYKSVPVVVGLVGAVDGYADVVGLFLGHLGELYAEVVEVEACNLLIEQFREDGYLG